MPLIRTALRAGAAAVAVAGSCGIAIAQTPQIHVMNLMLPDGGVAHVRYVGNTPPQVSVSDAPATAAGFPSFFGAGSPFAEMERTSAAMDRQAAQMFREAAALAAPQGPIPGPVDVAAFGNLPVGAREYQFVSTMMTGNGVCSRSVEITSQGNGAAPRVVTHASGNCGAAGLSNGLPNGLPGGGIQVPTQSPATPAPANGPKMIMTRAAPQHAPARIQPARIQEAALR